MNKDSKDSIGTVKWFGGYNSKSGKENDYGFIEDIAGVDVYLNERDWYDSSGPIEGQIVSYERIKKGGKYHAVNAKKVVAGSINDLLELLELLSAFEGNARQGLLSEFQAHILETLSREISRTSVRDIKLSFSSFDIGESLFEALEDKADWDNNRDILSEAGLLDSYFEKKENERLERERERVEAIALAKKQEIEKRALEEKLKREKDRAFAAFNTRFEYTSLNMEKFFSWNQDKNNEVICEWFRSENTEDSGNNLSDEQILAITDCSQHTLLRARAGSGKTTVIKHKIDFLINQLRYSPANIMALAFNSDAAKKIRREVQTEFRLVDFSNARTFHSLAYNIVRPEEELLFDEGNGSSARQSQLVQDLVRLEANPAFKQSLYEFFREELKELEDTDSLLSKEDYYQIQRARTQDTLKGDAVKSLGEKWIADFLFEHGINYVYERPWFIDGDEERTRYHPDFSLAVWGRAPDIVIEHWGIDELDAAKEVPRGWGKTWDDYHKEMEKKREFWRNWNKEKPEKDVHFLETSVRDLARGREAFESRLFTVLSRAGVNLQKLPRDEVIQRVVNKHISKFSNMCTQFISMSKKQLLSVDDLGTRADSFLFSCRKEEMFVSIALRIYRRYEQELCARDLIDFDDLIERAANKISDPSQALLIKDGADSWIDLRNIKWLLIDEYQDFSKSFYKIVSALESSTGQNFKLFCVGDDWQAINGFAGSDLIYFRDFLTYFPEARLLSLRNNYRSQSEVVEQGNRFMNEAGGLPSIPKSKLPKEPLRKIYANKIFIEQRNSHIDTEDPDRIYKTKVHRNGKSLDLDANGEFARILKASHAVILNELDCLDDTSFMFIARSNRLAFCCNSQAELKSKIKGCLSRELLGKFSRFEDQVVCTTAHRSKGAEADVVVLINVLERKMPILHPDNELFGLIGASIDKVYAEEERLFYVALTRARKRVYILTQTGRESEFLSRILTTEFEIDRELVLHTSGQFEKFSFDFPF